MPDTAASTFPTPALTITATASHTVVAVSGVVDAAGTGRLHTRLTEEIALRPTALILDLTRVTFCSARGLSIFFATSAAARAEAIPGAVVADNRAVLWPLRLLQLHRLVDLDRTIDDAVDRLAGKGEDSARLQHQSTPIAEDREPVENRKVRRQAL